MYVLLNDAASKRSHMPPCFAGGMVNLDFERGVWYNSFVRCLSFRQVVWRFYSLNEKGNETIMSKVVFSNTYMLKDGASVPDFILAVENLIKEHVSKQKGYLSFQLLAEGDTWSDSVTFETMDDLNAFLESSQTTPNDFAAKFYSFLDFSTCKSRVLSVKLSC